MKIRASLAFAFWLLSVAIPVDGFAQNAADLKKEIKARCEQQMGQYGPAFVLACMEQDLAAVTKIASYQKSHPQITRRCLSQMRQYGFALVEACVEQDIGAASAIKQW